MSNSQRIQENNARIEAVTELLKTKAGGGGFVPTGTIDITKNGLHNVKNYEVANVQVQPNLQKKVVEENGEVIADEGYDGLIKVVVNVPKELTANTEEKMTELLISKNIGKVVKYTGESGTYETNAYYVIEGV